MDKDEPIVVEGWVLGEALGEGGMGSVYVAHREGDPSTRAALKILDPDANVSAAEERFRREAEVLRNLDHPGIARFLQYIESPPVLVMEYIEGRDIKSRLEEEGAIGPREAVHITRLVAEALTYLHARGVWHRDVKPANVLVDANGYIRLVDFGIAVEDDGASRLTQDGFFMGTLPYVPPEALDADPPDPASWDLYSLGVVLQEMLTGEPAFARATRDAERQGRGAVGQLLVAKDEWPYLDPGEGFDEDLRDLVRAMTANQAKDRITLAEAGRRMMALRFPDEPTQTGEVPLAVRPESTGAEGAPRRDKGVPLVPLLTAAGASGATLIVVVALALVAMITVVTIVSLERPDETDPVERPVAGVELTPQDIEVVVAGVAADTPLVVRLAGQEPESRDGVRFHFADVEPGLQVVSVMAGDQCEPGCLDEACPCCATRQQRTVVGAAGATLVVQLTPPATDCVAKPEPRRTPVQRPQRPRRPDRSADEPDPPVEPIADDLVEDRGPEPIAPLVTHRQFSGFIRDNRKWDQRRAVAKGMADPGYLADWRGSNPPVGMAEWPVVEVSFLAARAFCDKRGGLARVDDGPHEWDVTPGQPIAELRELNGGPAVRFSIGVISTDVAPETTDSRFGFRCRRE